MNQCHKCQTVFTDEPYFSITNNLKYCSEDCLPSRAADHHYSFEYFSLVSSFRHFSEEKSKIKMLSERIELENEMELVIKEYKSIYLGDSEGHYYKSKIIPLYEKLLQFYNEVHDCLLQNDQEYYAVIIRWDELKKLNCYDQTQLIYEGILEEIEFEYFEFRNLSWESIDENLISPSNFMDIICFSDLEAQDRFYDIVEKVFARQLKEGTQLQKAVEESAMESFYRSTVKRCPVCGYWENVEDFEFSKELNLSTCRQSSDCY